MHVGGFVPGLTDPVAVLVFFAENLGFVVPDDFFRIALDFVRVVLHAVELVHCAVLGAEGADHVVMPFAQLARGDMHKAGVLGDEVKLDAALAVL